MAKIVVIDTSVVISALIGARGPDREVLRKCLNREYAPLISNALFQELEDVSVNKLVEEFSTQALAEFDSEVRFRRLASHGDIDQGLSLLDKLDKNFSA